MTLIKVSIFPTLRCGWSCVKQNLERINSFFLFVFCFVFFLRSNELAFLGRLIFVGLDPTTFGGLRFPKSK